MRYIIKLIVLTFAVYITGYLFKGVVHIDNFVTSILIALVLSLLNTFLRPILVFFTIPFTIVTFGLFMLVINAAILIIASKIVPGFTIDGFWWALFFSMILSFINSILEIPFKQKINPKQNYQNQNQTKIDKNDDHFDDYEEVK
jgi:putative membrane protein